MGSGVTQQGCLFLQTGCLSMSLQNTKSPIKRSYKCKCLILSGISIKYRKNVEPMTTWSCICDEQLGEIYG